MLNYDLHRSRSRSDTVSQLLAQLAEASVPSTDADAGPSPSPGIGAGPSPSPGIGAVPSPGSGALACPSDDSTGTGVGEGGGSGSGSWADRPVGLLRGVSASGSGGAVPGIGSSGGGVVGVVSPISSRDQCLDQGQGRGSATSGKSGGIDVVPAAAAAATAATAATATATTAVPPLATTSSSSSSSFDKVLPPKALRRSARALYRYLSNTLSSKVRDAL